MPPAHSHIPALILLTALAASSAAAQELGCDALVGALQSAGGAPRVTINPQEQTVRVDSEQGSCTEPISLWVSRDWSKVGPGAATQQPAARQPATPAPPSPAAPPPPRPAPGKITCDLDVKDFWHPGWFVFSGGKYWLDGVYAIDLDSDTRTDNLGFRFKSEDGSEMILRYFAVEGRQAASGLKALRLADETIIPRLCFGGVKIDKPVVVKKTGVRPFEIPNLAEQAKMGRQPKAVEKDFESESGFWFAVIAGGVLILLLAGGAVYWMLERRKDDDDIYGDDEDEDDEDGGDKADGVKDEEETGQKKGDK